MRGKASCLLDNIKPNCLPVRSSTVSSKAQQNSEFGRDVRLASYDPIQRTEMTCPAVSLTARFTTDLIVVSA